MNVTIAIDDDLLARARSLAQARGMSLQALLREQLERLVGTPSPADVVTELRARWAEAPTPADATPFRRDTFYADLLGAQGRRD